MKHKLEGTQCSYELKALTGREVIEHQTKLAEATEFVDVVKCRIDDLVDTVFNNDGQAVEDIYELSWQDVLIPLAIASVQALLPTQKAGEGTAKTEG